VDDRETDIAVIGGGICGVSCALHLRELGRSVAVLDADEIGAGGSGRALGLVLADAKLSPDAIFRMFGPHAGARMSAAVMSGPAIVDDLITRHGIDCGLTRGGWLLGAHVDGVRPVLEASVRYWRDRGEDVELVGGRKLQDLTGSALYSAAKLDRRAFGINPLAYVRGLARAAAGMGAAIHTRSRALSIKQSGRGWDISTAAGGRLRADAVVVATDAYTDDLLPALRRTIVPIRAYQLVSEPLDPAERGSILPRGHILTDTRRLYGGIRLTPDFRLQLSVDGPPFRIAGRAMQEKARARLRGLFPQLEGVRWSEEWSGWVGMTRDHVPHVHQLAPRLWAALGFNGRGIAMATLLGRDMARRLSGWPENELFLPETPLRSFRAHALARPVAGVLINWYRIRDAMDFAKRSPRRKQ
jgi:glycine/D-amino acid oxidase-like deaminating enzyme